MNFILDIRQSIKMYRIIVTFMASETKSLRMVISCLLGLFGIVVMIGGLGLAFDPSTDMTGTILIIVGLLLSFGAWRLWPSSNSEKIQNSNEQELPPYSAESFPLLLAGMSVVMTLVWSMMFTTGDDDLFWTWVIISPVYLICLGYNFSLHTGMVKKAIPFAASYALACLIWVVFVNIHGHPWGWSSDQFSEMMWLSILPPIILTIWNEFFVESSDIQPLRRVGIVASLPFCVTGYAGLIFFIPTLILLSLARLFFYNRYERKNES